MATLVAMGRWDGNVRADSPASFHKPNIIVILVDDMGYSDIGCYGGEIPTPNIDKLAAEGVRFRNFYNSGRCCPSRAELLTGLYAHHAGVGHMTRDNHLPGYRGQLNDQCVSLAEAIKPAGYFVAVTGKWHVGFEHGCTPLTRGFDASLVSPAGGFYYPDDKKAELYLNGRKLDNHGPELGKQWYTTDVYTDYTIKFIDQAMAAKQPFLCYLAYNAPHYPLQAPADEIAQFKGKFMAGWDKLREARFKKQIELGLLDPKVAALSPKAAQVPDWDSLDQAAKQRYDNMFAVYAACLHHVDTQIGHLMAALKERGIEQNTVVMFMSDNGGNAEGGVRGTFKGNPPGSPDSSIKIGRCWATLNNTPFQWYKHYNYEGGIATPLIVHWPAKITSAGAVRDEPGELIDIMATCVDLSGAKYPATFNGKPIMPMEGRSLVPAFLGQTIQRDALFWEHEGNAAIRVGDWKLDRLGAKGQWKLFNMADDRSELTDLAAKEPKRAGDMLKQWNDWAKRDHVYPAPKGGGEEAD